MCVDPVTIAALTAVASTGLGIAQASAAAQAQAAEYKNQIQYRQEQETQAQKTLNMQVAMQQAALESEKDKAQGEKADAAIEGYAAVSRAKTGAAESGIVGLSVDHLIGAMQGQTGRFNNRIDYNAKVATQNAGNELKMARRGAQARLAEIPIPVKPRFNMGLEIGSAVVSGIGTYYSTYNGASKYQGTS
jgi:hypothetical protein